MMMIFELRSRRLMAVMASARHDSPFCILRTLLFSSDAEHLELETLLQRSTP